MNNRVQQTIKRYKEGSLTKTADLGATDFFNLPKSVLLTAIAISTAAGTGAGAALAKTTESTETDYKNAQKAFSVGNLEASVISNIQKLKAERQKKQPDQKTMRLV